MEALCLRCHTVRLMVDVQPAKKKGYVGGRCRDCGEQMFAKGEVPASQPATDAGAPLFRASLPLRGQLRVYSNRIEVQEGAAWGIFSNPKTEMIPLRTISGVTVKGLSPKLAIRTTDGKEREFLITDKLGPARARDVIVSLL